MAWRAQSHGVPNTATACRTSEQIVSPSVTPEHRHQQTALQLENRTSVSSLHVCRCVHSRRGTVVNRDQQIHLNHEPVARS